MFYFSFFLDSLFHHYCQVTLKHKDTDTYSKSLSNACSRLYYVLDFVIIWLSCHHLAHKQHRPLPTICFSTCPPLLCCQNLQEEVTSCQLKLILSISTAATTSARLISSPFIHSPSYSPKISSFPSLKLATHSATPLSQEVTCFLFY